MTRGSIASLILLAALPVWVLGNFGCNDPPFVDPKEIDVALYKFYNNTGGDKWPAPWNARWGSPSSCAWDGNERAHPAPFGTRCLNGGWHKLPPQDDGGLLYLESYSRMADGPVPMEFRAFQFTDVIGLWNNKLTGPMWNTSMHQFLHRFDLSHNRMSGPLGEDFMLRNHIHAELINLQYNNFDGTLPATLSTLTTLQTLILGHNSFSGSIPDLSKLVWLRHIDLSYNKLTGPVPSFASNVNLARIELESNALQGPLPELPESVTHVNFSGNQFSGAIPASYGNLPRLRHFNCTGCSVTCPTPDFLAHVPFSTHCRPANARAWAMSA